MSLFHPLTPTSVPVLLGPVPALPTFTPADTDALATFTFDESTSTGSTGFGTARFGSVTGYAGTK
nr:hypothetical protein Q903MT_gene5077 [Picea sitchensis]